MRTIHNYRNLITPVINRILSRTIKCSKAHNLNASASVEGAIVIPLFIYAVMSIMFIMQVIAVRIHINDEVSQKFLDYITSDEYGKKMESLGYGVSSKMTVKEH